MYVQMYECAFHGASSSITTFNVRIQQLQSVRLYTMHHQTHNSLVLKLKAYRVAHAQMPGKQCQCKLPREAYEHTHLHIQVLQEHYGLARLNQG